MVRFRFMSYEIQKNIPIGGKQRGGAHDWPLLKMEPGDSFLVPISEYSPCRVHQFLATVRSRNAGWAWTARLMKHENGMRVWCIQRPDQANDVVTHAETSPRTHGEIRPR
jgi:hypothetical protein